MPKFFRLVNVTAIALTYRLGRHTMNFDTFIDQAWDDHATDAAAAAVARRGA